MRYENICLIGEYIPKCTIINKQVVYTSNDVSD